MPTHPQRQVRHWSRRQPRAPRRRARPRPGRPLPPWRLPQRPPPAERFCQPGSGASQSTWSRVGVPRVAGGGRVSNVRGSVRVMQPSLASAVVFTRPHRAVAHPPEPRQNTASRNEWARRRAPVRRRGQRGRVTECGVAGRASGLHSWRGDGTNARQSGRDGKRAQSSKAAAWVLVGRTLRPSRESPRVVSSVFSSSTFMPLKSMVVSNWPLERTASTTTTGGDRVDAGWSWLSSGAVEWSRRSRSSQQQAARGPVEH